MHRYGWLLLAAALSACTVSDDQDSSAGSNYAGGTVDQGDEGSGTSGGMGDGSGSSGTEEGTTPTGEGGGTGGADPGTPTSDAQGVMLHTGCATAYGSDVYTPFHNYGPVSTGTVSTYPWRGPSSYPDTIEDFRAYTAPAQVECGAAKGVRNYLDVTAGCLSAVMMEGDKRGQIQLTSDGYYRSFALPYDGDHARPVAWADQGVEYRFNFGAWTGDVGNPGFKAFVRYLTEYDLYVASWRRDGVVQIQKKQCGTYTILKRIANYGPPAPNVWHTIRFQIVGTEMKLYLDGTLAMTVNDSSITHGTSGIRIDSANGAYLDDWRVYAP